MALVQIRALGRDRVHFDQRATSVFGGPLPDDVARGLWLAYSEFYSQTRYYETKSQVTRGPRPRKRQKDVDEKGCVAAGAPVSASARAGPGQGAMRYQGGRHVSRARSAVLDAHEA